MRLAAACIAQCEAALGGTAQILVAAHGIQRRGLAEDFPLETWDEVMQVNLRSVFALCQQAAKRMIPQKYGKIILISSMSAFLTLDASNYLGGAVIPVDGGYLVG